MTDKPQRNDIEDARSAAEILAHLRSLSSPEDVEKMRKMQTVEDYSVFFRESLVQCDRILAKMEVNSEQKK